MADWSDSPSQAACDARVPARLARTPRCVESSAAAAVGQAVALDGNPSALRGIALEPAAGSRGSRGENLPLTIGERLSLLGGKCGLGVDTGDLEEQGEMGEGRPVGGRLGRRVRVRVHQRRREEAVGVGRQLAAHLSSGGRRRNPV